MPTEILQLRAQAFDRAWPLVDRGQIAVNTFQRQFGFGDQSDPIESATILPFIGVRVHAATASYVIGDSVVQGGDLWRAKANVSPEAWDIANFDKYLHDGIPMLVGDGEAAAPAYSFKDDPDTGLFRHTDDTLSIAVGGVEVASFDPTDFRTSGQIRFFDDTDENNLFTYDHSLDVFRMFLADDVDHDYAFAIDHTYLSLKGETPVLTIGSPTATSAVFSSNSDASQTFLTNQSSGDTAVTGYLVLYGNAHTDIDAQGDIRIRAGDTGGLIFSGGARNIIAENPISLPDGTETLPALNQGDDTDTGMYFPNTAQIALSLGGTTRVTWTNTLMDLNTNLHVGVPVTGPAGPEVIITNTDATRSFTPASGTELLIERAGSTAITLVSNPTAIQQINFATPDIEAFGQIAHNNDTRQLSLFAGDSIRLYGNGGMEAILEPDDFQVTTTNSFAVPSTYDKTTANNANVHISTGGRFWRSTSSQAYKTNITTLYTQEALEVLLDMRPVAFDAPNSDGTTHRYWGLIAEEVAASLPAASPIPDDYDLKVMVGAIVAAIQELYKRLP